MKIVFLNIWDARVEGVEEFLKNQDADIYCLQEAFDSGMEKTSKLFENYNLYSGKKYIRRHFNFSSATFIRKEIEVLKNKILFPVEETGFGIFTQLANNGEIINLLNFHGMPQPGDKLDNKMRIDQSKSVIKYFKELKGKKIIGGDFNLLLDTKSTALFEDNGYRNLIKDFNIKTTRNKIVWDSYPENKQLYADFVFVTPNMKVNNFIVPKNEVSDHLSMILEIE